MAAGGRRGSSCRGAGVGALPAAVGLGGLDWARPCSRHPAFGDQARDVLDVDPAPEALARRAGCSAAGSSLVEALAEWRRSSPSRARRRSPRFGVIEGGRRRACTDPDLGLGAGSPALVARRAMRGSASIRRSRDASGSTVTGSTRDPPTAFSAAARCSMRRACSGSCRRSARSAGSASCRRGRSRTATGWRGADRQGRGAAHPRVGGVPPARRGAALPDLRQRLQRRDDRRSCARRCPRRRATVVPWRQVFSDAWLGREIHNQVLAYAHAASNFGGASAGWRSSTPTSSWCRSGRRASPRRWRISATRATCRCPGTCSAAPATSSRPRAGCCATTCGGRATR